MIIKLLGTLAVVSLLMVPAFSEVTKKSCTCSQESCHGSEKTSCCSKSSVSLSHACICPSEIYTLFGISSNNGPANSYFGKSTSRHYVKKSNSEGTASSADVNIDFIGPTVNPNDAGPPDLDVVEYLPPSAKQVFNLLKSGGPLTQKDLIKRTNLPPRTIRYALERLRGEGMLEERLFIRDARQSLYALNGAGRWSEVGASSHQ